MCVYVCVFMAVYVRVCCKSQDGLLSVWRWRGTTNDNRSDIIPYTTCGTRSHNPVPAIRCDVNLLITRPIVRGKQQRKRTLLSINYQSTCIHTNDWLTSLSSRALLGGSHSMDNWPCNLLCYPVKRKKDDCFKRLDAQPLQLIIWPFICHSLFSKYE